MARSANTQPGDPNPFDPRLFVAAASVLGMGWRLVRGRRPTLMQIGETLAGAAALVSYVRDRARRRGY